jgi:hypothetical protein
VAYLPSDVTDAARRLAKPFSNWRLVQQGSGDHPTADACRKLILEVYESHMAGDLKGGRRSPCLGLAGTSDIHSAAVPRPGE